MSTGGLLRSRRGYGPSPLGDGLYRLDNTPWFARGVAAEDVVEAQAGDDGVPWFVRVVEPSGRLVVRVIPNPSGPLGGDRQAVLDAFTSLGVGGEGMSSPVSMVALDIGPDAPLARVKSLLADGETDGRWGYEAGCITDEWNDLP